MMTKKDLLHHKSYMVLYWKIIGNILIKSLWKNAI